MQYEVQLVVEGAMSQEELHQNEGAAYAAADRLAEEAKAVAGDEIQWCVYVTPHYCRPMDEDCICSWMPDTRPYRAS